MDKTPPKDPVAERFEVTMVFGEMLEAATGDGSKKRQAGEKPSWKIDPSHEAAIFSHLNKWKHGEKVDKDSGQHPLVHLAWRALAIAWQETHPEERFGLPGWDPRSPGYDKAGGFDY